MRIGNPLSTVVFGKCKIYYVRKVKPYFLSAGEEVLLRIALLKCSMDVVVVSYAVL